MAQNFWNKFKTITQARIGLGRTGASLRTRPWLDFLKAHSEARFAVHLALDWVTLHEQIRHYGFEYIHLCSQALTQEVFLKRPDWGRKLSEDSVKKLKLFHEKQISKMSSSQPRVTFVISEGLSALSVQKNSLLFLKEFQKINSESSCFQMTPIVCVEKARVGIVDQVGELMPESDLIVILLGERPGLSHNDSLGVYMTYKPRLGFHDGLRNCISNVREAGLPPAAAAAKLFQLMQQSVAKKISGISIKDEQVDEMTYQAPQKISSGA